MSQKFWGGRGGGVGGAVACLCPIIRANAS
uniref:Uncharacterized protein n=1 Tax=Anguilla anguilla TaxID=7936 RepID=A0A0E9P5M2_ANGAN